MSEIGGFREFLETAFGSEKAENEFWKKWCLRLKVGCIVIVLVSVIDFFTNVYLGLRGLYWDVAVDGIILCASFYLLTIIGKFEKQFGYWELKRRVKEDGTSEKSWEFVSEA